MIYYYKINSLRYTPFDENFWKLDFDYLARNGLKPTIDKNKANLFISSNEKDLKNFLIRNPLKRKFLLWTNEPRNSRTEKNVYSPFLLSPKVNIMNVYTNNVFISNVNYQEQRFNSNKPLNTLKKDFELKNKRIVALMSYYNGGKNSFLKIKGSNIDLIKMRSDIATYGNEENLMDIYGKGWPEGMAIEDSRAGNWDLRKKEVLRSYSINLCFENTVYPKYITEKIWDSIENYCLPIYYGGKDSSIYEIFPQESFIDYANFKNPADLFQYIKILSSAEYIKRMNSCIEVYNSFLGKPASYWDQISGKRLNNILEKAGSILHGNLIDR